MLEVGHQFWGMAFLFLLSSITCSFTHFFIDGPINIRSLFHRWVQIWIRDHLYCQGALVKWEGAGMRLEYGRDKTQRALCAVLRSLHVIPQVISLDCELCASRNPVLLMEQYLQGLVQDKTHMKHPIYIFAKWMKKISERRLANIIVLLFVWSWDES